MQAIKKFMTALAITAALAAPAQAQTNVERIQPTQQESAFTRSNTFYQLPLDVHGFSFTEYYDADNAFFGKTTLTKEITDPVHLKARFEYGSNFHQNLLGLGVDGSIVNIFVSGHLLKGMRQDDLVAGYFVSIPLSDKIKASAFGDFSIQNTTWGYGEVSLLYQATDDLKVGYNCGLLSDYVSMTPALEHRVQVQLGL